MTASKPTARAERRDDIQGIRVIGALLVFSFHVFFSGVSGGVDVFFVISGYFMAANAVQRDQLVNLAPLVSVYRNFLLRIAPQAIVALIGITLLVFFFSSPMTWLANLRDISASAVYLENWNLIRKGQDYLARSESVTLAQHFWAVALIGQTYLLWPFILRLSRLVVRARGGDPRRVLLRLVALLSAVSLCWSLYFTQASPTSAYFDFFSRFWEFGCGVMLGLRIDTFTASARPAALLSWLGLALLVGCGFIIGSSQAFPGYAALWPVTAAVLLIRYARPGDRQNAGWLLSRSWLARWGGVSFGVYLWHWPLYVVYENATQQSKVSLGAGLVLLALAAGGALLSKKLVDWWFAVPRIRSSKTLVPLGVLTLLVVISASSELVRKGVMAKGEAWDDASASAAGFIAPGPFSVRDDNASVYKSGCHQSLTSEKVNTCSFGPAHASKTIVVVGGSHSAQWLPALVLHVERKGWRVIAMTKSGCLFADPADKALFQSLHESCARWNIAAMKHILALQPDMVLTLATRSTSVDGRTTEYVPAGYLARFEQLSKKGIRTAALRDNPWMPRDVPVCVYSPAVTDKNICGEKRDAVLNDVAYAEAVKDVPDVVNVVDLNDNFCDNEQCWATRDDVAIYRDSNHITATYAEKISPALLDAVDDAFAQPAPVAQDDTEAEPEIVREVTTTEQG